VNALAVRVAPLTLGHGAVDFVQGAVPALLPYLVDRFGLSYTAAGAFLVALTAASSITQPVFGHLADRRHSSGILPLAIAVSAVGFAGFVLAPSAPLALGAVAFAGLGVAAYHPEAARIARAVSGASRAEGMALFSVGGNVGVALGPAFAGPVARALGLRGAAVLAVPVLAAAAVIAAILPRLRRASRAAEARVAATGDVLQRGPLAALLGAVTIRGYTYFGLLGFVPLLEVDVRGHSKPHAALVLALFLASGAAGTLVAGRVADRVGLTRAMVSGMLLVSAGTALYLVSAGPAGLVGLALGGAGLVGTFSVSTVLAQTYMPGRTATASGLVFGLSIGAGGLCSLAVGAVADQVGLRLALTTCIGAALLAAALAVVLPEDGR
jgi:FSR family fosmidomycin resistance protein-like MFS transporter